MIVDDVVDVEVDDPLPSLRHAPRFGRILKCEPDQQATDDENDRVDHKCAAGGWH